jgi:hypothetical protein
MIIRELEQPLCALVDFFQPPAALYSEALRRMQRRGFQRAEFAPLAEEGAWPMDQPIIDIDSSSIGDSRGRERDLAQGLVAATTSSVDVTARISARNLESLELPKAASNPA